MPPSTELRPTDVVRRLSPAELRAIADLTDPDGRDADLRAGARAIRSVADGLDQGGAAAVEWPAYRTMFLPVA